MATRWLLGSVYDSPTVARPDITVICTGCYTPVRCDDQRDEAHRIECRRCGKVMNVVNVEPAADRAFPGRR